MILLAAGLCALVFVLLRRRAFPPAVLATQAWARARPRLVAYVRAAPATFGYLAILAVTSWVLLGASTQVADLLLREHSTNLHQMLTDPVRALIRSAFWVPGYTFLLWAVLYTIVLAPAERWLGTRRWAAVFIAGHVLATLGVALGLWLAIQYGWASHHAQNTIDVGVSYGFAAVAGIFTYRLPGPWRWRWAASLATAALVAVLVNRTFTDAGHLLALGIGFACLPLTRGEAVRSRATGPIWTPPSPVTAGG